MRTKKLSTLLALLLGAMLLLTACAQTTTPPAQTEAPTPEAAATPMPTEAPAASAAPTEAPAEPTAEPEPTPYDPYHIEQELAEANAALQLEYAPVVKTLDSGVQIQRTPIDGSGFNTYVLNSDARGCFACHNDLAELVHNMPQDHMDIQLVGDTEVTIQHCISCHQVTHGYVTEDYGLASYIHGYHSGKEFADMGGTCLTCHDIDMKSGAIELWDIVKYNRFRGIIDIDSDTVEASFTSDQTTVSDSDDIFSLNWVGGFTDYMIYDGYEHGLEPVPETFDTWEVTVDGLVDNPFTMTLPELIEEFGSVTRIMTLHCTYDPAPGGLTATCEVTGIPVKAMLEKAGVQEGAIEVYYGPPDEICVYPVLFEHLEDHESLLVYEINGRRLKMAEGYPLWSWNGGMGAPSCVKQVNRLTVAADPVEELYLYHGWDNEELESGYMNRPCCAFIGTRDGQIVPAYEPLTLEGFADGYADPVVAVEISMDRGATWTTYPVDQADTNIWLHWTYTFTPEEGAYVITARAVTASGRVSETPDVRLINAQ